MNTPLKDKLTLEERVEMLDKQERRTKWASEINWNEMAWIVAVVLINIFILSCVIMTDWDEGTFVFTFISFNCLVFLIELMQRVI